MNSSSRKLKRKHSIIIHIRGSSSLFKIAIVLGHLKAESNVGQMISLLSHL